MRHYRLSGSATSIARALLQAEDIANNLFGKQGYLGLPLSDVEKEIYKALAKQVIPGFGLIYKNFHLAISDSVEEGKWLITAGPRKGQLFWDHSTTSYGPGAEGSGWSAKDKFWEPGQPDGQDYAMMYEYLISDENDDDYTSSLVHYDLLLWEGEIFARPVNVRELSSNPIMKVDLGEVRRTTQRHLILTEDHISVDDPDTHDPLDDNKVDASKIELRIMNIPDDTLYARISMSDPWVAMTKAIVGGASQDYYSFTLAQLQGSLISLRPKAAGTLTFQVQAADDAPHLSDSDPYDPGAQPESISISVVALETVAAGEEVSINGDGALTRATIRSTRGLPQTMRCRYSWCWGRARKGLSVPSPVLCESAFRSARTAFRTARLWLSGTPTPGGFRWLR